MNSNHNLPPGCLPNDTDDQGEEDRITRQPWRGDEERPAWMERHGEWMKEQVAKTKGQSE